jgi:PAS domain S-box-containing protein
MGKMQLNLLTAITLITCLSLGVTVVGSAIRWARRTHPGSRRWAIAGLLLVLSLLLLSFRSAPAWINVISANTGIALAAILYLEGTREFRGLSPHSRLAYGGGVVAIGSLAFFFYIVPNMNFRAAVMSTFLAVVFTLVSILLFRGIPPAHRFGFAFTGTMFALCGATLFGRALYCYFGPPMNDRYAFSDIHGALFFAIVVEMSAFSLGLNLLADERVISAMTEIRERAISARTEVARLIEAQVALRESDERFRFVQRAAGIGTFDWNIETGVNTWTPELEAMYGLPPGSFPGSQKAFEGLLHPDDVARAQQQIAESFEVGAPVEAEWRIIWPDGSLHWIAGRWQVFKNAAGEPIRMLGINIDITERKNVEEALRRSEARWNATIENLEMGVVIATDTEQVIYRNPAAFAMHGFSDQKGLGPLQEMAKIFELWTPDGRLQTLDEWPIRRIKRGETLNRLELRLSRPDQRWEKIISYSGALVESAIGERLIFVLAQDVTNQRKAEQSLRVSEERFRLATNATNDSIYDIDLKTGVVSWNDTYANLFGRPPATSDSWQWWIENIHPEDREYTVAGFRSTVAGRSSTWTCEYRFRRVSGEWAYIYDRAYIARDASGNAWRVIGAMQDLTERKSAESALRESEERFRRVFEEGPLGIGLVGPDYRFLRVNAAFCQMVDYSQEELLTKTFGDITHPDDLSACLTLTEQLFHGTIPFFRTQKRYLKKTGEIVWINVTGSTIRDLNDKPLYGIAMIEDITEIKRANEEALVRQKLESVGTLANGIAHDFNNLLGAVQAQAELASTELGPDSACQEELKTIRQLTRRGSEIVRQLMIYSGTEAGDLGLFDVSNIVDEMLALLKVSVTKRAMMETQLGRDLPRIRASAAQLRQIVLNLITNASDAIGDRDGVIRVITSSVSLKGESPAVSFTTLAAGDYVQLEVSDTGRGMSTETRAKVFDPFFSTKSAGRGLGLAVVQGIVRSLGGGLHLTSEPDKGTTFQILLPSAESAAQANASGDNGTKLMTPIRHGTVLIVEDEDALRQATVKMLRRTGFEVLEAADGASAIARLRTDGDRVDIMLLDLTIPGASHREVIAEAAKAKLNIGVILTSAYSAEAIAGEISPLPIHGFIRKPFQFADLLNALRNALSKAETTTN